MALTLQLGLIGLAVTLVFAVRPATAQTSQFLPEVDGERAFVHAVSCGA